MADKEATETVTEDSTSEDTTITEETTATEASESTEDNEASGDTGDTGDTEGISDDDFESLQEKTKKEIRRLRRAEANGRTAARREAAEKARKEAEAEAQRVLDETKAAHDEQIQNVARALGLLKDDKAPELTHEQLLEQITKERDEERTAREQREQQFRSLSLEVAVQDAANMHGGIPEKLLDSRKFMRAVEALDPSTDGYRVAVAEEVSKAIEADKTLRAEEPKQRPPAVSGGTTVAGTGKGKSIEDMSIEEMISAGFTQRR